jgi:outer membrane protein assembly factor BamA
MLHSRPLAAPFLCLLTFAASASAQQVTLSRIKFVGDDTHTQAELLSFSGLKPGASTQQAVQDAAQRLGDTGFYDGVTFQSDGAVLAYTLKPAPATALLPLSFTNFVWWDDKELLAALDGKVPLYHGGPLPIAGNTRDAAAAVLQDIVAAKGVPNPTVSSQPVMSHPNGAVDTIAFSIASPPVLIHKVTLLNVSPALQPKLVRVINWLTTQQWDKTSTLASLSTHIGEVYHSLGYLDFAVTNLDRSDPVASAHSIDVDLTATLSEGEQYHVAQITWAGSSQLSAADFARQSPLKPGDPVSSAALGDALELVSNAHFSRGFIDTRIDAPPQIDRAAHRVAYTITVQAGPEYHFTAVHFTGLPDDLLKSLASAWHMRQGDIYDGTYPTRFLGENSQWRNHGLMVGLKLQRDLDHNVDITLVFNPRPLLPASPIQPPPR